MTDSLTIVCISDTHELHRELDVPSGDILIHAGDYTMFSKSASAILDFNEWLGELPHRERIIGAGNHEFFLEADPSRRSLLSNATVLINESVEVEGLRIWVSPVTTLYGGAFGLSSPADREWLYATIPADVDILVTHGPPYGILDRSPGSTDHVGCPQLLEAVRRIKPKLHIFGHVHGAHGTVSTPDTLFINAALLGPDGDLDSEPIVVRLPRVGR
jgi:predicted phosphohydrolase